MGWGRTWGRVWGGAAETSTLFEIVSVRASGSNAVRVTFTLPPMFRTPVGLGDASRLSNWTLTRTDLSAVESVTIMASRAVTGEPNVLEFIIAGRWPSRLAEYRLVGSAALEAASAGKKIVTPAEGTFFGAPAVEDSSERTDLIRDIYNPQNEEEQSPLNGGLSVATDGDYNLESGVSLVKKLILRELLTSQDEFVHLADVEYGLGLQGKEGYSTADLPTLRKQVLLRVQKQPEVVSANVGVDLYPDGRLEIRIKARTQFGELEFTAPITGVSF